LLSPSGVVAGVVTPKTENTKFKVNLEKLTNVKNAHGDNIDAVAFLIDGELAASGSFDEHVKVWNSQSGELVFDFKDQTTLLESLKSCPTPINVT